MTVRYSDSFTSDGRLIQPSVTNSDQCLVNVLVKYALPGALANGDVLHLCKLPAHCVPVDFTLVNPELDTNASPTCTFDLGILASSGTAISTDAADGGAAWLSASTAFQNASLTQASGSATSQTALFSVVPSSTSDRTVAIDVTAALATAATTGTIYFSFTYRNSRYGQ